MAMVCRQSPVHILKKCISYISWPIVIEFHVNHNKVGRKAAYCFCSDWIGSLVVMAT